MAKLLPHKVAAPYLFIGMNSNSPSLTHQPTIRYQGTASVKPAIKPAPMMTCTRAQLPVFLVELGKKQPTHLSWGAKLEPPGFLIGTLPETNIFAPTNGWLEYYFPIGFRPIFRGEPLVSGRVKSIFFNGGFSSVVLEMYPPRERLVTSLSTAFKSMICYRSLEGKQRTAVSHCTAKCQLKKTRKKRQRWLHWMDFFKK